MNNRLELTLETVEGRIGTEDLIGPLAGHEMAWDAEGEDHTESATFEVVSPEGAILEQLTIGGNEWRDIEDFGKLEIVIEAVRAGIALDVAVARALEQCPVTPEPREPIEPSAPAASPDLEILLGDLADNLRAAVARFELANAEGNPAFAATLPDARKALALYDAYRGAQPTGKATSKPRSLMAAYADNAGMAIEAVMAALRERPDGSTLIGWSDFRAGWEARGC